MRSSSIALLLAIVVMAGAAQLRGAERTTHIDIPEGRAADTLKLLAEQTGMQLIFRPDQVAGVITRAVRGEFAPLRALVRMLQGGPLAVLPDEVSGVVAIVPSSGLPPESVDDASVAQTAAEAADTTKLSQTPLDQDNMTKLLRAANSIIIAVSALSSATGYSQSTEEENDEIIELSPFEISANDSIGYMASTTLAGTRLRTNLSDIGSSVTVLTEEFLEDIGGTDSKSVLAYATNFEVGGTAGNYQGSGTVAGDANLPSEKDQHFNPSSHTRVRGLVSADNTRNYFRTTVGWDGYNVSRIDLLRGPNSILFGLGSPGGVVNATVDSASLLNDRGEVKFTFDQFGSKRYSANYNKVIMEGQLGIRVALLSDEEKYRQEPAFDKDERYYVAGAWSPPALNKSDATSFRLSANFEKGNINANRPRTSPPADQISMAVDPLVIKPIQLPAGSNFKDYPNGIIPGVVYDGVIGYSTPYVDAVTRDFPTGVWGQWGTQPMMFYEKDFQSFSMPLAPEGSRNADGSIFVDTTPGNMDTGKIWGSAYVGTTLQRAEQIAGSIDHPFSASFRGGLITDPTIFDFYNNLLDGPNKNEWVDFDQFHASLSHTFLNNTLGYELTFYQENAERGQGGLTGSSSKLYMDLSEATIEGAANPFVGRPMVVQDQRVFANRVDWDDLEAYRLSAFMDYDFRDAEKNWWRNLLGRHVVNAAYNDDKALSDSRIFHTFVLGDDFLDAIGYTNRFDNNRSSVRTVFYLSDENLLNRSSLSGARIPRFTERIDIGSGTVPMRYFDTTWVAEGVDPAASWIAPSGQMLQQHRNPSNYAGWTNRNFTVIDAMSGDPADRDLATNSATLQESTVESTILSWQGFLFDGALVGTYGWRRDESASNRFQAGKRSDGGADLSNSSYNLANGSINELEVESTNFSAVVHLNRVPFLERLPVNVSLSYNEGENFNPTAGRLDWLGRPLPAPSGETEEFGVLLSTKDNRYVLRVQKYETKVLNNSSQLEPRIWQFSQILGRNGARGAFRILDGQIREQYEAMTEPPEWSIDYQEEVALPAWYEFESRFAQEFPEFVDTWLRDGTYAPSNWDTNWGFPGATNTEDSVSDGVEIEFTANPTENFRFTLNASKTEAIRDNVPGETSNAIYSFIHESLWDGEQLTPAGQMRSGYGPFDRTVGEWWRDNTYANHQVVAALNGQKTPEVVEWRYNAIGNYTFNEGALDGFGVGGAYRYQSGTAIGYYWQFDELGLSQPVIDSPAFSPSQDRVDGWLRYQRKFGDGKYDWSIQLNVYNLFGDNELLPVNMNPDGTIVGWRIIDGRSWRVTNTFRF